MVYPDALLVEVSLPWKGSQIKEEDKVLKNKNKIFCG
jgi:hypothetical protein